MSADEQAAISPSQFSTGEVLIRKEGADVIVSPRPTEWGPYLDGGPVASAEFMDGIEHLPVQERGA